MKRVKKIVDEFLRKNYQPGMTSDEISAQYALYGKDPFIIGADEVPFRARDYARMKAEEIFQTGQSI